MIKKNILQKIAIEDKDPFTQAAKEHVEKLKANKKDSSNQVVTFRQC